MSILKLFSFSMDPRRSSFIATVLILVGIGAAYFFWYVPGQQEHIEQRQFRCLQRIENNLHQKIDNSVALLRSRMDYYLAKPKDGKRIALLDRYRRRNGSGEQFSFEWDRVASEATKKDKGDTVVISDDHGLAIRLWDPTHKVVMEVDYTFEQFFGPLFQRDIYDEYIIFRGPRIVYQTFPSGTEKIITDSLKSDKSVFSQRQIKQVNLAGTDYKLFSQQALLSGDSSLTVTGLLKSERYDREKNLLPPNIGILLFIFALSMVLALPWIKQFQLGSSDRITAGDVMACMGVALLLTGVIFFMFFQYAKLSKRGDAFESAATKLSGQIKVELTAELSDARETLSEADKLINCERCDPELTGTYPVNSLSGFLKLKKGIRIAQIFSIDSSGKELRNWLPDGTTAPTADYSDRAYFRDAVTKHFLYLDHDKKNGFTVAPVISRITGSFTTAMCIESASRPGTLTAMSFDLRVFKKRPLTAGFRYSLIDATGNVLYDSDTTKRLNENILEELSGNTEFAASVQGRRSHIFSVTYAGSDLKLLVDPVKNTPYSVIITESNAFRSARETNTFVFTFCMLIAFLAFIGLGNLLIFWFSARENYYKKHYFDMSWFGPRNSASDVYLFSFLTNILLILIVIIVWACWDISFKNYIFLLVFASQGSYLLQNYYYTKHDPAGDKSRYAKIEQKGMLFIMIATVLVALCALQFKALIVLLIVGSIFWLAFKWYFRSDSKLNIFKVKNAPVTYSLMTFSRFVLTAGLPVMVFYVFSYNYYQNLSIHYRQLCYGQELIWKEAPLKETLLKDSVWVYRMGVVKSIPSYVDTDRRNTGLQRDSRFFRQGSGETLRFIGWDGKTTDGSSFMTDPSGTGPVSTWIRLPRKGYLQITSVDLSWGPPLFVFGQDWHKTPLYYLCFLLSLGSLCLVFHHVVKRLFALDQDRPDGWKVIDQRILLSKELNNLVFLIGPPGSGKLTEIEKMFGEGEEKILGPDNEPLYLECTEGMNVNVFIADMIHVPNEQEETADGAVSLWKTLWEEAKKPKYKLIIINHFEYDIRNDRSNSEKLNLLEDLLQKNQAKVMIISTVHPVNFLDSLNQNNKKKAGDGASDRSPEHDLERWHVLLGHFRIVIQPLRHLNVENDASGNWQRMLSRETASGHFLQKMRDPLLVDREKLDEAKITENSIALKLGMTAHYFYMYVWQSLTKEEKFLLYDLAEDGLINGFDDYNLTLLISKGLITDDDGRLRLFNLGFRQFILTAIGRSEALAIQNEIKDNGNWKKLRSPLILIIFVLLIFLFTSQKESYLDLMKYVTMLTAGVPLILQLFNYLGRNSDSASEKA